MWILLTLYNLPLFVNLACFYNVLPCGKQLEAEGLVSLVRGNLPDRDILQWNDPFGLLILQEKQDAWKIISYMHVQSSLDNPGTFIPNQSIQTYEAYGLTNYQISKVFKNWFQSKSVKNLKHLYYWSIYITEAPSYKNLCVRHMKKTHT